LLILERSLYRISNPHIEVNIKNVEYLLEKDPEGYSKGGEPVEIWLPEGLFVILDLIWNQPLACAHS